MRILPFGSEIGKKFLNFIFSHIFGMGLVVEEDKTPDPIYVRLFRSIGIMLEAYSVANLVEKLSGFLCHRSTPMFINVILILTPVVAYKMILADI